MQLSKINIGPIVLITEHSDFTSFFTNIFFPAPVSHFVFSFYVSLVSFMCVLAFHDFDTFEEYWPAILQYFFQFGFFRGGVIKYDISCRFFIDALYKVEGVFLYSYFYKSFCYDCILDFVEHFLCLN